MLKFLAVLLVLFPVSALSCSSDIDCDIDSHCAKARGAPYGTCVGGLLHGNPNEALHKEEKLDAADKDGVKCSFDIDCAITENCVKAGGSIEGVCARRR